MPSRVPFRWADVAVAATVFFAATLTLTAPLIKSRAQMAQAACAFNLGKLGVSLAKYTSTHGTYPFVPGELSRRHLRRDAPRHPRPDRPLGPDLPLRVQGQEPPPADAHLRERSGGW